MFTIQTPQSIDLLTHDPANPPPPVLAPVVRDPGDPHVPIVPLTPAQLKGETPPTREEWARAGYAPNKYPGAQEGAAPAEPEHHGTIRFDHEGADVSKCRMIITRDDKVFTYVFNTGGNLVSAAYEDDKTREAKAAQVKAEKEAEDKAAADAEVAKKEADKTGLAAPVEHKRETESANQPAI
jgi:hypothetical protein